MNLRRIFPLLAAVASFTILASQGRAQPQPAPTAAGRWHPLETGFNNYRLASARERAEVQQQFTRILEVFKSSDALRPPLGVDLTPSLSIIPKYGRLLFTDSLPAPAMMWIRLNAYLTSCPGCAAAPDRYWGGAVYVVANDLDRLFVDWRASMKIAGEAFWTEPAVVGTLDGFPIYEGGRAVLITRRTAPPFIPVSQERYLAARIREARALAEEIAAANAEPSAYQKWLSEKPQRLANYRQTVEALRAHLPPDSVRAVAARFEQVEAETERTLREQENNPTHRQQWDQAVTTTTQRLRDLEAQLAALSPEQRRATAWTGCHNPDPISYLCKADDPGVRRLVVQNPDFFDRSLPRTVFQSLVLFRETGRPPGHPIADALEGAWRTLDWQALAALLHGGGR